MKEYGERPGMSTIRPASAGVDATVATAALVVGDAVLIAAFVVAGEVRHYPLDVAMARTPGTLLPFLIGWFVAAPVAGLFGSDVSATARGVAVRTAAAWVGATVLATALRATSVFHGDADVTFALVAVAVGLVLLVPWRVAAAALTAR